MKFTLATLPSLQLAGFSFYGDPFTSSGFWMEENEIGRLWARLMAFLERHAAELPAVSATYEVHVYSEETATRGLFEVFTGFSTPEVEHTPVELLIKVLPAAECAVFTVEGEQIASDWYFSIDQLLAEAGYARSHAYTFQYYDERFKGMDRLAESTLEVYVPVRKLAADRA